MSRHIIGKVGDAPVSYARWRIATQSELGLPSYVEGANPDATFVAVIDRFCVLPAYRRKGYGAITLHGCLLDIAQMMVAQNVALDRVSLFVHCHRFGVPIATLAKDKMGFDAIGPVLPSDPAKFYNPGYIAAAPHAPADETGVQEFALSMDKLATIAQAAAASAGGGAFGGGGAS